MGQDSLSTRDLLQRYSVPNYGPGRLELAFARGEGVYIWDEAGNRYLDFGAGIAVCSLGHCHPAAVKAVQEQAATLWHCSNLYGIRNQGLLAEEIVENVVSTAGKVFFANSGAEANEAAYKLARKFGHETPQADGSPRYEVITFNDCFHGRTLAGLAATAQQKVRDGFAPLPEGFVHVPYNDLEAVRAAIKPHTAAILLEPLQGEGGIHPATPDFLRGLAQLCRERNLLLMFDEIQCGIGRLGHPCGWKAIAPDVTPDAVTWAKGLGDGFPIGALWIRDRPVQEGGKALCDVFGPGSHGSTFGGQPVACAAALAVLREIREQRLWENAAAMGRKLVAEIQSWRSPFIADVRGLGLMLGIALNEAALAGVEDFAASKKAASAYLVQKLTAAGLLTIPAGTQVVRLLPPLNITDRDAEEALRILRQVFQSLLPSS